MNADYKLGYVGLSLKETDRFISDESFRELVLLAAHNISLWKENEWGFMAIDRFSDPFSVSVIGHRKGLIPGLNPTCILGRYTVLHNKGWRWGENE